MCGVSVQQLYRSL